MLKELVSQLQQSLSILHKQDIQTAARALSPEVYLPSGEAIRLGDDCAAIPDGDGYLLLAAEAMSPQLVEQDPWFAGWCAIMVNLSDIAAMGGTAIAVVDALWSRSPEASEPLWQGLKAASQAYNIPIVGGHTNCHSPHAGLAVAILGRAEKLITSFDAQPGDTLMLVIDLQGQYYGDYPFWDAATRAEPQQLRKNLARLPQLAQAGLCRAGKDISMGGLIGTLLMLAETSRCGAVLDLAALPRINNGPLRKWLTSFPSFGFLLSVPPENVRPVQTLFPADSHLTCCTVGVVTDGSRIYLQNSPEVCLFWNWAQTPLTKMTA